MSVAQGLLRRWRNLPFARKLALLILALVTLPMVVMVSFTTYESRHALILSNQARNLERARGTAELVDRLFADARADVRTASSLPAIVDVCSRPSQPGVAERAALTLRRVRDEQGYLALYVTDQSGRVLVATDHRVRTGTFQTGRAFLAAMAGNTVVDDPAFEAYDGRVALRVSNAVRSADSGIIGTVTALIDVRAIDAITARDANYGGHGEFAVLWTGAGVGLSDSSGSGERHLPLAPLPPDLAIVVRQRLGPAYVGNDAGDAGLEAAVERGAWVLYDPRTNPHLRIVSERLGALQATVVPLTTQQWVYGIFVPEDALLATLDRETIRDWSVAFFTVVSALALSLITARWVSQPLHRVIEVAGALASGDTKRRVSLQQEDEFGELGKSFDAMADALTEKEDQLQAYAAELERRVEQRTAVVRLFERASQILASSLEPSETSTGLAALLVPGSADFCAIHVRDQHGQYRLTACRHADPDLEHRARRLLDRRPPREGGAAFSPEERAALHVRDLRAYELSAGYRVVGRLTVAMAGSGRTFDEGAEIVFAELGRRAGLALANAQLYQDAQEANRLKDEFLGVVSHELRTPLNAIVGWNRLAANAYAAGRDPQRALDAVERNARALTCLVDDLLDVPRIIAGKLALDLRPVDLVSIVSSAVDAIRPAVEAGGLAIEFESDMVTATLDADAARLQQVFGNLLSNAVKFTPAGGSITVRVRQVDNHLAVTVQDTGIGIPPELLPRVFDRFWQADSSTMRAHGGLGLGLAIVQQLAEMHGGYVTAASEGKGRGSSFTVHLPLPRAHVAHGHEPAPHEPQQESSVWRGLRPLIVDDDPDAREVTALLLESAGASPTTARSAAEALDALSRTPDAFDVVLADIGMPEQDGFAFVAEVRTSPDVRLRTVPMIAVTAYASMSDRARAISAGFDAHVAKPVSLDVLTEALMAASRRRAR